MFSKLFLLAFAVFPSVPASNGRVVGCDDPLQAAEWSTETIDLAPEGVQSCVAGQTFNGTVYATWGPTAMPSIAPGYYRIYVNPSQTWSYSPGRWHNAFGDPYKTNTGGTLMPTARFSQLVFRAPASSWKKYAAQGQLFYHPGGSFIVSHNDRPGEFGDNAGAMTFTLVKQ